MSGIFIKTGGSVVPAAAVPSASAAGGVLDQTIFYPAATTVYTPSATLADLDATYASVTFVTPPSGVVFLRFDATMEVSYGTGLFLNLREGSTNLPNTKLRRGYATASGGNGQAGVTASWIVQGLTPGSTHTYKVGFATIAANGPTPTVIKIGGDDTQAWGPMVLAVSSSPL